MKKKIIMLSFIRVPIYIYFYQNITTLKEIYPHDINKYISTVPQSSQHTIYKVKGQRFIHIIFLSLGLAKASNG